jgi:HSP90 family molecular chaperone
VQNATDAIDDAFACGVLTPSELGRVDITVDAQERTIRVRDNGVGVPAADAERVLTSFGASAKRGKSPSRRKLVVSACRKKAARVVDSP